MWLRSSALHDPVDVDRGVDGGDNRRPAFDGPDRWLGSLAGDVSTIGAVPRNGPPDDFHNQATQFGDYGKGEPPPAAEPSPTPAASPEGEWPQFADPLDEAEPNPWYRKPAALIAWIVAVLVLIGLIVFGVLELLHGEQGTSHTPSTTTSTTSTSTTTTTTTTATTAPTTTEPSTSNASEPPAQQPTQQQPRQPTHRHHLPQLPSVITIPEVPTVITLPPGLN